MKHDCCDESYLTVPSHPSHVRGKGESCFPSILQSKCRMNSHQCLLVSVPAKVIDLKENSSASSGEQTVTCSAEGMPQPEISWSSCSDIKWYVEGWIP